MIWLCTAAVWHRVDTGRLVTIARLLWLCKGLLTLVEWCVPHAFPTCFYCCYCFTAGSASSIWTGRMMLSMVGAALIHHLSCFRFAALHVHVPASVADRQAFPAASAVRLVAVASWRWLCCSCCINPTVTNLNSAMHCPCSDPQARWPDGGLQAATTSCAVGQGATAPHHIMIKDQGQLHVCCLARAACLSLHLFSHCMSL